MKQNSKPIFGIFGFFSSGPWIIRYSAKKKNIRIRYSDFKILIFGFGFEVPNTRYSGRILGFESISLPLVLKNHQSGRLTAKIPNSAEIAFWPFWSNVTYSPDSPVNVLIESRNVRKMVTVSSNRIYKMHEITFIHVTSTHCRI